MVEAAISDVPSGSVTLHQIAGTGLSTLLDDVGAEHQGAGWAVEDVTVPARRLDDILADAGWDGLEIHFMIIDVEGAEQTVLETLDLRRWRPWVMVVEATRPQTSVPTHDSWESILIDADYRFCIFDGLSRFYVAAEKWADLHALLEAPANILDRYKPYQVVVTERENDRLHRAAADLTADRDAVNVQRDALLDEMRRHDESNTAAILQWRTAAVRAWAAAASGGSGRSEEIEALRRQIGLHVNHIVHVDRELEHSRGELDAMRRTLSWRITTPLRRVRGLGRRSAR